MPATNRFYFSFIILFLMSILFFSCSSIRSGRYVYVTKFSEFELIAKENNLSLDEFKKINPKYDKGKEAWVFVPMRPGLFEKYKNFSLAGIELLWPVPSSNKISSDFGERWGKSHEGIDIPAKRGSHIMAAEDGKVVFSGNSLKTYGNMIILKHAGGFFTIYAHAQKLHVSKGDTVSRGQIIANVGSTGRSTGPHLHFELRKNTEPLNPKIYISKIP